jgi:hypothetical protein
MNRIEAHEFAANWISAWNSWIISSGIRNQANWLFFTKPISGAAEKCVRPAISPVIRLALTTNFP